MDPSGKRSAQSVDTSRDAKKARRGDVDNCVLRLVSVCCLSREIVLHDWTRSPPVLQLAEAGCQGLDSGDPIEVEDPRFFRRSLVHSLSAESQVCNAFKCGLQDAFLEQTLLKSALLPMRTSGEVRIASRCTRCCATRPC